MDPIDELVRLVAGFFMRGRMTAATEPHFGRMLMTANSMLWALGPALLLSAAAEADVVVASNLPATQITTLAWEEIGIIAPAYNNYNNVSKGQQFIPTASGVLTSIDAIIGVGYDPLPPNYPPLNVSLYTSLSGIPIAKLATRSFSGMDFFVTYDTSRNHRKTIDFIEFQVPIIAGNQYLVAFETPYGLSGESGSYRSPYLAGYPQTFLGLTASQARDGNHWELFSDSREIGTVVRVVPEPSTELLLLAVIGIGCLRSRFRQKK